MQEIGNQLVSMSKVKSTVIEPNQANKKERRLSFMKADFNQDSFKNLFAMNK